jgi:hypothetical protein
MHAQNGRWGRDLQEPGNIFFGRGYSQAHAWIRGGRRLRLNEKKRRLSGHTCKLDVEIDGRPFLAEMRRSKQRRRKIRVVRQTKLNDILTPLAYDVSQILIHGSVWSFHGSTLKLRLAQVAGQRTRVTFWPLSPKRDKRLRRR